MKKLILLLLFVPLVSFGQETYKSKLKFNPEINLIKAEASCGICMLNMEGKECELAVKIKYSKYYVVGTGIDDYGDAHSEKGFCNAIRKADIQGEVIDNKFHITYFKLR
jgi:hypothetical protein